MAEFVAAPPESPYKGLAPFDDSDLDALLFFGRKRERDIIAANLLAYRLTVLYGASGVGKSSVLNAGVAHSLRRQGETVVVFSSWSGEPVRGLLAEVRDALADRFQNEDIEPDAGGFADSLTAWSEALDCDIYLILDQLDEYFLYHDEADAFTEEFAAAATREGLRVNFMLAIREDMLSRLDRFKGRIPNLLSNYLRLDHLDRESARAAIVGPVERFNALVRRDEHVELEPALVEAVLDQTVAGRVEISERVAGEDPRSDAGGRVEAPFLQLVMQRLWDEERAGGAPTLRLETLERLGGAEQIVRAHLSGALEALSPEEQDLAATLFNYLVTPSGTKIAHGIGDLAQYAALSEGDIRPVLSTLVEERIVRPVTEAVDADGSRYEIFHDVLAEPVAVWRARHEAGRELERQRREAQRRHRRLLAVTVVALIGLAAMTFVTVFALAQRREARAQRAEARAQQAEALAAKRRADGRALTAASAIEPDPVSSLGLAVRGARLAPSANAEDVLRRALVQARVQRIVRTGDSPLTGIDLSPRSGVAVAGNDSGKAFVIEIGKGVQHVLDHGEGRVLARIDDGGTLAVTGARDGSLAVWDARTGERLHAFRQPAAVNDLAVAADRSLLVAAGSDGHVRGWQPRAGAPLYDVPIGSPVRKLRLSRDGSMFAVVAADGRARVVDARSGGLLHVLDHAGVTAAAFSPGGKLVATVSTDGTTRIWELPEGYFHKQLRKDRKGRLTDIEFSRRGGILVTASTTGASRVWSAENGDLVSGFAGHTSKVEHASFSPDGAFVVSASTDGTAQVWRTDSGRLLVSLVGHKGAVVDAEFGPGGEVVATAGEDGTVRFWNPHLQPKLELVGSERGAIRALAAGGDGVLAGTVGGRAALWRLGRRRTRRTLRADGPVLAAASRIEPLVIKAGARRSALWNVATGERKRTFEGDRGATSAASTPTGRMFATARGRRLRVWRPNARPFRVFHADADITAVALSADGRRLAAGSIDGVVRVWDIESRKLLRSFGETPKPLLAVALNATGTLVATGGADNSARIWNVQNGGKPTELPHQSWVRSVAFSPDGRWLATTGSTTVPLWEVETRKQLFLLRGHTPSLRAVAFGSRGIRVVSGDDHGTVRTYLCRVCGGLNQLVRLAEARLARLVARR